MDCNVLQDVWLHPRLRGPLRLERRKAHGLIGGAQGLVRLLAGVTPLSGQACIWPATLLRLVCDETLLLFVRVQSVLECLKHASSVPYSRRVVEKWRSGRLPLPSPDPTKEWHSRPLSEIRGFPEPIL